MLTRRTLLRAAAVGGVGAAALPALPTADPAEAQGSATDPVATFVSMPDFFNGDVGDLRVLPNWDNGLNSVNSSWENAIDHCLGAVAAHSPDAVFIAGDMVEGRWNIDSDDRRLFGRVSQGIDRSSLAHCRQAITTAGGVYYSYHRKLFADRGLKVYGAVGDHEILDDRGGPLNDRWSPSGIQEGVPDNRYYLVDHAKSVWADHWTRTPSGQPRFSHRPVGSAAEFTSYSVDLGPKLTLITVDVFTRTSKGVRLGVFGPQLSWLRSAITRAKKNGRIVIVQGHIPVMAPYRSWFSGDLRIPEGRDSTLYRALSECGADFYFTGEVHDTTVIQRGTRAPIQISHGCIFRYGFNYLVGNVYADGTTRLDYYEVPLVAASNDRSIWSTDVRKRQRTELTYGEPTPRGTLVVKGHQIVKRTLKLGVYDKTSDTWGYKETSNTVLY